MRIFVGNLPYDVGEQELRLLFDNFGEVADAAVITDRESGMSRGFGFVTMPDESEAREAITELADEPYNGRPLRVNEAKPRGSGNGGGGGGPRW